jgi:hypothetical protein
MAAQGRLITIIYPGQHNDVMFKTISRKNPEYSRNTLSAVLAHGPNALRISMLIYACMLCTAYFLMFKNFVYDISACIF